LYLFFVFSVAAKKQNKMARRRKEVVMPHLNDCGGDLTKKWYVEYSIRNPQSGEMERIRNYDEINRFSTCKGRFAAARKVIKHYTDLILSGSISHKQLLEYEDLLLYDGQGSFTKKRMAPAGHIRIYISEFMRLKKMEVKKSSYETYRSKFRFFYLYIEEKKIADKPVTYYTNDVIIDFLRYMVENKGLSRVTLRKYEELLHNFFKFLTLKKVIGENPVFDIPKMGIIKDESPAAIPQHMRLMLRNAIEPADPQLWMFICFMYYMAIRPGNELRLMRLNQINYSSRTVTIYSDTSKSNETRTIDIPDNLFDLIVNEWGLQAYDQTLYVFGKSGVPDGDHLGKNNMYNRHAAFRKKLGLPKPVTLYSWKHSGAQELADNGASIYEIQRHLRHRDITTTEMYLKKRIGQRSSTIKHNFPTI
jgi:integrase